MRSLLPRYFLLLPAHPLSSLLQTPSLSFSLLLTSNNGLIVISCVQGVAAAQPQRTVWCLDGDGAALMHLGTQTVSAALGLTNLKHVLLNNAVHDSVGGQPTSASQGAEPHVHTFSAVAKAVGYTSVVTAKTAEELQTALLNARANTLGPVFIEAMLSLGTRKDLGRPKTSTSDSKASFMGHLATTDGMHSKLRST